LPCFLWTSSRWLPSHSRPTGNSECLTCSTKIMMISWRRNMWWPRHVIASR
jgi:hypothetical protein